jgi:RHS repeat-associated protein
MTDASAKVVMDQDYLPFGGDLARPNQVEIQNDTKESYKYTGQKQVVSTGLYYYGARYYDPEIGRFVTEDSYRGRLHVPQNQNLYLYVLNNPLKYTDPDGHDYLGIGESLDGLAKKGNLPFERTVSKEVDSKFASELFSIAIGFTPVDVYKDAVDLAFGRDVMTGDKMNRLWLGAMILTPEIVDKGIKAGLKYGDEVLETASDIDKVARGEITDLLQTRVNDVRSALPSKLKRSGNAGLAKINIEGLPNEIVAHSRINKITDKGAEGFALLKNEQDWIFKPKYVDPDNIRVGTPNACLRKWDTEFKILDDIAGKIGDNKNITGKIDLFTERATCASCSDIIMDFRNNYPNIKLDVYTGNK